MKSSPWIVTATALLIVLAACQSGSETQSPRSSGQNRFGYQGTQSAQTQFADATPTPTPSSKPTPEATPEDTAPSPTPETTISTTRTRHSLRHAGSRKIGFRDEPARALCRLC